MNGIVLNSTVIDSKRPCEIADKVWCNWDSMAIL